MMSANARQGVRALLAGDRRVTGAVLKITAAAWTAGSQWWRSGDITRTHNVSEYMLVLAVCLVEIYQHFGFAVYNLQLVWAHFYFSNDMFSNEVTK